MFRMEISEYDHIFQLFKGGGEQNRSSELSRTSCPSIWGRIYLANKNPIYLRAAPWWEGGEVLEVRLVSEHRGGEDGF